tara:strand:- start:4052 stop:4807 length:756 start_codon:yes stop_codon:yes gene_type:complete
MFENIIEFISHKDYVEQKEDYPRPIKINIPDWYKKLEHGTLDQKRLTIKGCMPFLDTLTSGYSLQLPQDIQIQHNVWNEDLKEFDSFYAVGDLFEQMIRSKGLNLNFKKADVHGTQQLEGSPYVEKNKNLPFYKIMNPWIIKTPPGYSCLFLPPMNNSDDRFSIIPGIVDTDKFTNEINFPIIINGDKYKTLKTILKKGLPYVQIIPFKRESWKMKISGEKTEPFVKRKLLYMTKIIHIYKDKFWSKKSWK